jgi:polysaccharide export outer membrane protein
MKVVIRLGLLATSILGLCTAGFPQSKPPETAPAAEQKAGTPVQPGPNNATDPTKAPAAPGVETEPGKLGQPAARPLPANPDPSYVIGAEDVLGITVWGDNRLSGRYGVRPDGRISMPLIGEITATALTPAELEGSIADTLKAKDILRRPQVTVQVDQINSKKYFLQGEVMKTGSFPLLVPTTVLEALVNAGGFKDFANVKKIEVMRGTERLKFNYKDVIHGKHADQNIKLKPGDIIIVP